jgi:hypothetical protein
MDFRHKKSAGPDRSIGARQDIGRSGDALGHSDRSAKRRLQTHLFQSGNITPYAFKLQGYSGEPSMRHVSKNCARYGFDPAAEKQRDDIRSLSQLPFLVAGMDSMRLSDGFLKCLQP